MKSSLFLTHIAAAIVVTGIMFTIYVTVQQTYRSGANDTQLQLAREISIRLNSNKSYAHLLPDDTIELSNSLATFVTLYNEKGEPVQSTGMLGDKMPQIPAGVINFTRTNKEDIITWMPRNDVRQAIVVEATNNPQFGFVVVGRSLKEVEVREKNLVTSVFIAWIACMAVIIVHSGLQLLILKRQKVKGSH